jgi:hypothetical protein
MDTSRIVGEVAQRHKVLLDPNDPVLVMGAVSEMVMQSSPADAGDRP